MKRGGIKARSSNKTEHLIGKLFKYDCSIKDEYLKRILSLGDEVVPYLEEVILKTLQSRSKTNLNMPLKGTEWFVLIHALYLLAHLESEKSLNLILDFIAQEQKYLDYWLHDLLDEDMWEIPYLLGQNQVEKLQSFIMDQKNNMFSRIAVATALIQIALHFKGKANEIEKIFKALLLSKEENADFIGLLVNELMDWRSEELRQAVKDALNTYHVYEGIISVDEVEWLYENKKTRICAPLSLFARYEHFRQQAYFRNTDKSKSREEVKLRKLEKTH